MAKAHSSRYRIPRAQIDHDGLFKELIRMFAYDFLALFTPALATSIAPNALEFLDKELFQILDQGERKEVDLLLKAKWQGQTVFFLIHIEVQADAKRWSPKRMFFYTARLMERFDLPVFPIAVLSYDTPKKAADPHYHVSFPDLTVLQFQFRLIQLNRLNWRDFMRHENPIAAALMAKMNIPKEDRPKVKLECLRMIATLRLDPAKSALIAQFMETYLHLNRQEEQMVQKAIEQEFTPEETQKIMRITNSWIEQGIGIGVEKGINIGVEKGINIGLEQGIGKGLDMGAHTLLHFFIEKRFGQDIQQVFQADIERLTLNEAKELLLEVASCQHAQEIAAWFTKHKSLS